MKCKLLVKLLLIYLLFLCASPGIRSQITISGHVTDLSNNDPLPGVNVVVKNTNTGTVTDQDGNYSLTVPNEKSVLVFSFIGYLTEEIMVGNRGVIDVVLVEDITALDEVIVIGYGTQKRSDLTGAIASVNTEDMQKMPVVSVEEGLQGRAAGVYVNKNSGQPGSSAKIFVRGPSSINDTDPLWIIDGVKSNAGPSFNMNDVKSVEVLKDAAAAAIYGSEAANGVILVTTKRGEEGKTKLNFNSYVGWNNPINIPKPLNTRQYAEIKNFARDADGLDRIPLFADYPEGIDTLANTNWADAMFHQAMIQNYEINASGGSSTANFYISANYLQEEGTMVQSSYKRFGFRANSDFKIGERLKIGESLYLSQGDRDPMKVKFDDWLRAIPTMPVYDDANPYGGFGSSVVDDEFNGGNPVGVEKRRDDLNQDLDINANIYLDFEIIKGLNFRTTGGLNYGNDYDREFSDAFYFGPGSTQHRNFAMQTQKYKKALELIGNALLTFNKEFGNHNISALIGTEVQKKDEESFEVTGQEFVGGTRVLNNANKEAVGISGKDDLSRKLSQLGRLNYNYQNKYYFQANIRRDGSSKFGSQNRWGVFPSLSLGWRLDNENFLDGLPFISLLKLRGGWGKLGNDNIPNYTYSPTYNLGNFYYTFGTGENEYLVNGTSLSKVVNDAVHWETVVSTNVGVDVNLFRDRIQLVADYYVKNTLEMLMDANITLSSGYMNYQSGRVEVEPKVNIGEVQNKGAEFAIIYKEKFGGLNFNASATATYNQNEVKKLSEEEFILDGSWGNYAKTKSCSRTEVGQPMGYFYGYITDGIFQSQEQVDEYNAKAGEDEYYQHSSTAPGDLIFRDIAGVDEDGNRTGPDGRITEEDKTFIGNPWPKWVYGLSVNSTWKYFDLSLFFQGLAGRDIYNGFKAYYTNIIGDYNMTTDALNAWTPENTDTDIPRITWNDNNGNGWRVSTRYVENGSYLRLKNLQLGFTLPAEWSNKIGIEKFRIYGSAMNVFTITGYTGMDPEFNKTGNQFKSLKNTTQGIDNGTYPNSRTILLGLQIGF